MDRFTKQVLDRTVKDLTQNFQIYANKRSVLCLGKWGAKLGIFRGKYDLYFNLGKYEANRYKFALNEYRRLAENLLILEQRDTIGHLFELLQATYTKS